MSRVESKPNWLFRALIAVSLLAHVVVFIQMAKIYRPRSLSYLELTMRSVAKPVSREIPRPRIRPPSPSQPEKVLRANTLPLKAPVAPPSQKSPAESVPDVSGESVSLPQAPVVKDLNVAEWVPPAPVQNQAVLPSTAQPEFTEEDYRDLVDRKIRDSVQYPERAKKRNLQGRVTVAVTIGADGEIAELKITQSSGHRVLDRAVLKAVSESAPFSNPPDGPVTVIVPIQFRLI